MGLNFQRLGSESQINVDNDTLEKRFTKFNLSSIPANFCNGDDVRQILTSLISKSNIVHFRNPSEPRSYFVFKVNEEIIAYATHYKYLRLVLSEHLYYALPAKVVANRTLGLIAKTKAFSGLQYDAFTKLYVSIVFPVIRMVPLYGPLSHITVLMQFKTERRDTFLTSADTRQMQR